MAAEIAALPDASECLPILEQLAIGARCILNWGLVSLDVATVTIGDDVQIGRTFSC